MNRKSPLVETILNHAAMVYRPGQVVDCVFVNGQVIPKQLLPAGLPSEWVAECNARQNGRWR